MSREIIEKKFNDIKVYTIKDLAIINRVCTVTIRNAIKYGNMIDGIDLFNATTDQINGKEPYIYSSDIKSEYAFELDNGQMQIRSGKTCNISSSRTGHTYLITDSGLYKVRNVLKSRYTDMTNYAKDFIEDDSKIFDDLNILPMNYSLFRGVKVYSRQDISNLLGISVATCAKYINTVLDTLIDGMDYFNISKNILDNKDPYILQFNAESCDYAYKMQNGTSYALLNTNGPTKRIFCCNVPVMYFTESGKEIVVDLLTDKVHKRIKQVKPVSDIDTSDKVNEEIISEDGRVFRGVPVISCSDFAAKYKMSNYTANSKFNKYEDQLQEGIDYLALPYGVLLSGDDYVFTCNKIPNYRVHKINENTYSLTEDDGPTSNIMVRSRRGDYILLTKQGEDKLAELITNERVERVRKLSKEVDNMHITESKTITTQEETIETKPTVITVANSETVSSPVSSASLLINNLINAAVAAKFSRIPIPKADANGKVYYDNKDDEELAKKFNDKVNALRSTIKEIFGEVTDDNLGYVLNILRMNQDFK